MLHYSKSFGGRIVLMFKWYGSAFPRSVPPALLSAVLTYVLHTYFYKSIFHELTTRVAYQAFAYTLGVMTVFHSNSSYQRYMSGRQQLQAMTAHWADAAAQAVAFDSAGAPLSFDPQPAAPPQQPPPAAAAAAAAAHSSVAQGPQVLPAGSAAEPGAVMAAGAAAGTQEALGINSSSIGGGASVAARESFARRIVHAVSLLHALALQHLRGDWDLDNLCEHTPGMLPPSRAPSTHIAAHRSRAGFWFPRDCFTLRTGPRLTSELHALMPLPVLGGLSREERAALEGAAAAAATWLGGDEGGGGGVGGDSAPTAAAGGGGDDPEAGPPQIPPGRGRRACGTSPDLRRPLLPPAGPPAPPFVAEPPPKSAGWVYVQGPAEAVNAAMGWALRLLVDRKYGGRPSASGSGGIGGGSGGGLGAEAPIVAQVFARLSQGYGAFEAARLLVETPFPFAWSQIILVLLFVFSATLPVMVVSAVKNVWIAVLADFLAVATYFSVEEAARDFEDPFFHDPNELPLPLQQYQLNLRILRCAGAALAPALPRANEGGLLTVLGSESQGRGRGAGGGGGATLLP